MDWTALTIDAARAAVQERQTTSVALVESHYERIQKEDSAIGAYLTLTKERALEQADRMDRLAAEGKPLPPLGGVPIAIKDVMCTRGVRTTAGSKILENFLPPYDCTAVARLEAAGAVILGKLNCDEFAMGSSNENSAYHPVRNPRDTSRVPGGSSGARQRQSRPTWQWSRWVPIPAARSGSLRHSAAWLGSCRPTDGSRAMG